jgi:hypothetical protein
MLRQHGKCLWRQLFAYARGQPPMRCVARAEAVRAGRRRPGDPDLRESASQIALSLTSRADQRCIATLGQARLPRMATRRSAAVACCRTRDSSSRRLDEFLCPAVIKLIFAAIGFTSWQEFMTICQVSRNDKRTVVYQLPIPRGEEGGRLETLAPCLRTRHTRVWPSRSRLKTRDSARPGVQRSSYDRI